MHRTGTATPPSLGPSTVSGMAVRLLLVGRANDGLLRTMVNW